MLLYSSIIPPLRIWNIIKTIDKDRSNFISYNNTKLRGKCLVNQTARGSCQRSWLTCFYCRNWITELKDFVGKLKKILDSNIFPIFVLCEVSWTSNGKFILLLRMRCRKTPSNNDTDKININNRQECWQMNEISQVFSVTY